MIIVLFEDSATDAKLFHHWIEKKKRGFGMRKLEVAHAAGDWWDFLEGRVHRGEPALAPSERARAESSEYNPMPRRGAVSSFFHSLGHRFARALRIGLSRHVKEFWLIDLDLRRLQPEVRTKLSEYFVARCSVDRTLSRLVVQAKNTDLEWSQVECGLAIAAYGQQHSIPRHFVSAFASLDILELRNLLSYLALNQDTASEERPFAFSKMLLKANDQTPLTIGQDAEYEKVFDWVWRSGRHGRSKVARRFPFGMDRDRWYAWGVPIILGIVFLVAGYFITKCFT